MALRMRQAERQRVFLLNNCFQTNIERVPSKVLDFQYYQYFDTTLIRVPCAYKDYIVKRTNAMICHDIFNGTLI